MRSSRNFGVAGALWLVCVAAAAGVLATGQEHERQNLRERFESRAETGASFVAAYVSDVFDAEHRLAERVTDPAAEPAAFAGTAELLGFSAAVLLDDAGRVLAVAPRNPDLHGTELASGYRHLSAALAGDRAVSDVVPSAVEGEPIVAFALPLDADGFGVLSSGFTLADSPLQAFLERQPIAGTRGYIVDSTGTVIVSAGDGSPVAGSRAVLPAAPGTTESGGRLVATTPVRGTAWTYVLDAPVAAVMAPLSSSGLDEWAVLAGLAALTLTGMLVAAAAVGSRARARTLQHEADRRFRLTVEHAPIGMAMVGLDHRFVEPNNRLCRMLGYSLDELESMTFDEVTHAEDLGLDLEKIEQLVSGESDFYEMDKRYVRRDGSVLWGRLTVSVVRDDHGDPLYFVSQIEDVTAIRAAQEDLERRAMYDPLTGLANRGLLIDRLDSVLHSRTTTSAAVAFCDLDLFKEVNDSQGHHAGDAVLQEVGRRLSASVREDDTVARMGGDEFVLLLTEVGSVDEARQVVDRATRAVAERPIEVDGALVTIGISSGLAVAEPSDSATSLLRRADAALYAAKEGGRGGLEVHDVPESHVWPPPARALQPHV